MDDEKDLSTKVDDFLQKNSPFDEMNVTLDTRYVDVGVGYSKKGGTKLSAAIDLNNIGKITEDDLAESKRRYQKEVLELDLEKRKLENERLKKSQEGLLAQTQVLQTVNTSVNTTVQHTIQQKEAVPEISDNDNENDDVIPDDPNHFGAKAYLNDDE